MFISCFAQNTRVGITQDRMFINLDAKKVKSHNIIEYHGLKTGKYGRNQTDCYGLNYIKEGLIKMSVLCFDES